MSYPAGHKCSACSLLSIKWLIRVFTLVIKTCSNSVSCHSQVTAATLRLFARAVREQWRPFRECTEAWKHCSHWGYHYSTLAYSWQQHLPVPLLEDAGILANLKLIPSQGHAVETQIKHCSYLTGNNAYSSYNLILHLKKFFFLDNFFQLNHTSLRLFWFLKMAYVTLFDLTWDCRK